MGKHCSIHIPGICLICHVCAPASGESPPSEYSAKQNLFLTHLQHARSPNKTLCIWRKWLDSSVHLDEEGRQVVTPQCAAKGVVCCHRKAQAGKSVQSSGYAGSRVCVIACSSQATHSPTQPYGKAPAKQNDMSSPFKRSMLTPLLCSY